MQRILVTGASGLLGTHISARLGTQGYSVFAAYSRHPEHVQNGLNSLNIRLLHLDLTRPSSVEAAFRTAAPHAVVHVAAMADLSPCEQDKALARTINIDATAEIAKYCNKTNTRLIFLSTDQVFDGSKGNYSEEDRPNPIHEYGFTKAEAEKEVLAKAQALSTIVRVALVYGRSPTGRRSCSEQVVYALRNNERLRLFTDEIRNPVYAEDVASAIAELMVYTRPLPYLHLGGPDTVSRYEIGRATALAFGLDPDKIEAVRQKDMNLPTPRPKDLSLNTSLAKKLLASPPRPLAQGLQEQARTLAP
ncbi:MAG: SDR family oxidoreductase [Planctomycetota bacterium]